MEGQRPVKESAIPFCKNQSRLVFGNNKFINPQNIDNYIVLGGYQALVKALFKMTPARVMAEVKNSKLRGRGEGGFPTGLKWETTRNTPVDVKCVIVNADEGDPGALGEGRF
jgi:NADH-quinone oxidoreductase subunit F